MSTVLLRGAAHALLVTPYMQSAFLLGSKVLQTNSFPEGVKIWKEKFPTLYSTALKFWPPVTLFFYLGYIPLHYGNLYMDSFALAWAIYMSYFNNMK